MLITVTGLYRTGTTALFNVVRLILKHSKKNYEAGFYSGSIGTSDINLLKIHSYNPYLSLHSDIILTTYREKSEIINSMKRLDSQKIHDDFKNASNYELIDQFIYWQTFWNSRAHYIMNFEDLLNDPDNIFYDVVEVMIKKGLTLLKTLDLRTAQEEFNTLRAPKTGYDKTTLLTETHIKQR